MDLSKGFKGAIAGVALTASSAAQSGIIFMADAANSTQDLTASALLSDSFGTVDDAASSSLRRFIESGTNLVSIDIDGVIVFADDFSVNLNDNIFNNGIIQLRDIDELINGRSVNSISWTANDINGRDVFDDTINWGNAAIDYTTGAQDQFNEAVASFKIDDTPTTPVPEPSTIVLLGLGLAVAGRKKIANILTNEM